MAQQPLAGRSSSLCRLLDHSDTPHSVGLLWTGDQPAVMPVSSYNTQHSLETSINAPAGLEPGI